jgi:hypothetical protein
MATKMKVKLDQRAMAGWSPRNRAFADSYVQLLVDQGLVDADRLPLFGALLGLRAPRSDRVRRARRGGRR